MVRRPEGEHRQQPIGLRRVISYQPCLTFKGRFMVLLPLCPAVSRLKSLSAADFYQEIIPPPPTYMSLNVISIIFTLSTCLLQLYCFPPFPVSLTRGSLDSDSEVTRGYFQVFWYPSWIVHDCVFVPHSFVDVHLFCRGNEDTWIIFPLLRTLGNKRLHPQP